MIRFTKNNIDPNTSIASLLIDQTMNLSEIQEFKLAMFDARVFQITSAIEVENYFIWRQQDATRNSISSVAQSMYSPSELHKKNTDAMQELIFQKGINWNDYSPREKRGSVIRKFQIEKTNNQGEIVNRSKWMADQETPIFTQDREFLGNMIPKI
jgi:tRNA(His) 5'-end guanylyltransferase